MSKLDAYHVKTSQNENGHMNECIPMCSFMLLIVNVRCPFAY